ncbi:hypothetical protein V6N11_078873 [Hibiscus sabdariffa]|uniref:Uncharacterized protein n=1 Tax=Hibiscus sabdariffa TaxID=183260 RepID=A0ABR2RUI2_9ROSI
MVVNGGAPLWEEKDVYRVLTENIATKVIEGMIIDNKRKPNKMLNLNVDAFSKMKKIEIAQSPLPHKL